MSKINFDNNGNIYPYTVIELSLIECEKFFIENFNNEPKRRKNWDNFLLYRKDLLSILSKTLKQWIDGSYTTIKLKPNDIDVVSFIDYTDLKDNII